MLEDLSIPRIFPSHATNSISWNQDGVILIFSRDDLIVLNPKNEITTGPGPGSGTGRKNGNGVTGKIVSNQLGEKIGTLQDLFKISRLSTVLQQTPNFLNVALIDDEIIRLGQCNRDYVTNLSNAKCNVIELKWSNTRVDFNTQRCLLSFVTDSLNGIIGEYQEGKFVELINISEQFGIDIGSHILTSNEIKQLRIHSICWFDNIEILEPPIWPVIIGSMIICFSESDKNWIYQIDSKNGALKKIMEFNINNLDLNNDEYVNKSKNSGWIKSGNEEFVSYVAISTSFKRIILKRVIFKINEKRLFVDENFEKIILNLNDKQGVISNFEFSQVITKQSDETVCLSILSSGKLDCVLLNGDESLELETISTKLSSLVSFNSIAHYKKSKEENGIISIILSNPFKDLLHYKLSIDSKTLISVKKYEYNTKISDFEIPLINKLNEINRINKFRINSMCIDPSGNNLAVLYSIYEPNNTYLDTNIRKFHEEVFITIVPLHKVKQDGDYNGVNPHLILQEMKLNQAFHGEIEIENKINNEINNEIELKYDNAIDNLQYELFLRKEVVSIRRQNAVLGNSRDDLISRLVAQTVVKLVAQKQVAAESAEDRIAYRHLCQVADVACETAASVFDALSFEIPGLEERETLAAVPTIATVDGAPQGPVRSVVSVEGHEWRVCSVSLVPLTSPLVRRCSFCGSRAVAVAKPASEAGQVGVVAVLVGALPVCVFCGGCYV